MSTNSPMIDKYLTRKRRRSVKHYQIYSALSRLLDLLENHAYNFARVYFVRSQPQIRKQSSICLGAAMVLSFICSYTVRQHSKLYCQELHEIRFVVWYTFNPCRWLYWNS